MQIKPQIPPAHMPSPVRTQQEPERLGPGPTLDTSAWDNTMQLARAWRECPGPAWGSPAAFQATSAAFAACAAQIRAYVAYQQGWREWWTTGWRPHGMPSDTLVRSLADCGAALADAIHALETATYWLDYCRLQEGYRRSEETVQQLDCLDQETGEHYGRLLFVSGQVTREFDYYSQVTRRVS